MEWKKFNRLIIFIVQLKFRMWQKSFICDRLFGHKFYYMNLGFLLFYPGFPILSLSSFSSFSTKSTLAVYFQFLTYHVNLSSNHNFNIYFCNGKPWGIMEKIMMRLSRESTGKSELEWKLVKDTCLCSLYRNFVNYSYTIPKIKFKRLYIHSCFMCLSSWKVSRSLLLYTWNIGTIFPKVKCRIL